MVFWFRKVGGGIMGDDAHGSMLPLMQSYRKTAGLQGAMIYQDLSSFKIHYCIERNIKHRGLRFGLLRATEKQLSGCISRNNSWGAGIQSMILSALRRRLLEIYNMAGFFFCTWAPRCRWCPVGHQQTTMAVVLFLPGTMFTTVRILLCDKTSTHAFCFCSTCYHWVKISWSITG